MLSIIQYVMDVEVLDEIKLEESNLEEWILFYNTLITQL